MIIWQLEGGEERIDCLGFNGTFSTNRLYRAFDKIVGVK